jgi:hypothetical protein
MKLLRIIGATRSVMNARAARSFVPQIDSASGTAVLRSQNCFSDQNRARCGILVRDLDKRSANLLGANTRRQLEAGNDRNQVVLGQLIGIE